VIEVHTAPFDESVRTRARLLDAEWVARTGNHAWNEAVRRDIAHGGTEHSHLVTDGAAAAYLWRIDTADPHWELTLVRDGDTPASAVEAVGRRALEIVGERNGGEVVAWVPGDDDETDAMLRAHGFGLDRVLLQLRVPLPITATPVWPEGVAVRTFEPGRDDDAFLAVNNRAFAGHPEQGGWDHTTLAARLAEPWFDPNGFLLAVRGEEVVGFCWMKLHTGEVVPISLGEIYAVGVDPRAQGGGVGRPLAIAGLAWAAKYVDTGMLYVDAANSAAVKMYESLGFREHLRMRAYLGRLA
jgi:mycothiol synthase